MANETPRMKITYPSLGEANYFSNYQAGMNDIDAGIFATWSASNTITNGGGTLTWALVGPNYTLTWTAPIAFQTPAFGTAQSIALGSLVIPQGLLAYTDIAFGSTAASTSLVLTAVSQAPVDTAALVLAWHNPTTHALHFATGLVLALGGTATGIQPQGGGGGSISVTDGSTTVNPTTILGIIGATVSNIGGTNAVITIPAPVTPPLITQFVVAQDGTGSHSQIYKAIDSANGAFLSTGVDQIVFVRGGTYTENITFKSGVRVIAEGNPNAKQGESWAGVLGRSPTSAVVVVGQHYFETGVRMRTTIQGITFASDAGNTVFAVSDTTAATENTIQFFDCLLFGDSMAGTVLIEVNGKNCPYLSMHFERCRFLFLSASSGAYDPMMLLGSNGSDQNYTFVDCRFDTKGYTGRVVFRSDNASGAGETRFTRCNFAYADIDNNGSAGFNRLNSDLWLTDVVIDGPERYPVTWNVAQSIYVTRCTLGSVIGGGYEAITTGGSGFILLDNLSYYPSYVTNTTRIASGAAVATYAIPARSIEGGTYVASGTGTVDLEGEWVSGHNYTNVAWDTVGSAGTRNVQLSDAQKSQGMYVTVWDSGNNANSRNITVTSPASGGGVVGPNTSIVHANGSLMFVATIDKFGNFCWRSVSYLH